MVVRRVRRARRALTWALVASLVLLPMSTLTGTAQRRTLYWGTSGSDVATLQWRLQQWGYYDGPIDGVFGNETAEAVRFFQWYNGLTVDGLVGPETWAALGFPTAPPAPAATPAAAVADPGGTVGLLARLVAAEARGEPYAGQVGVAAVILNRVQHPDFPKTVAGVVFQPHAFESVSNGLIWARQPTATEVQAAVDALNGWDPTYGAIFFWNPAKPVNPWIWTRTIITQIGRHVFAR